MSLSALRRKKKLYGFALALSDYTVKIKDAPDGNVVDTATWSFDAVNNIYSINLSDGTIISLEFFGDHDLRGKDQYSISWTATLIQNYNP